MAHRARLIGCVLALLAPWLQAQETYGKADDPVVAEVHGMQIRTSDGDAKDKAIDTPWWRMDGQSGE